MLIIMLSPTTFTPGFTLLLQYLQPPIVDLDNELGTMNVSNARGMEAGTGSCEPLEHGMVIRN